MMLGNKDHVSHRERRVHAYERRGRLLDGSRPAGPRTRSARRTGHLRRRQSGRGPRDPHRARRNRAQAADMGEGSWESRGAREQPRSTRGFRTRSSTPTATSSRSRHCFNDEMLTYLEEMGGRDAARPVPARHAGSPTRRPCSPTTPVPAVRGLEGDAVVVGLGRPQNVRDRATAHLPALLYERLDEIGIDFTILYPSMALGYFEVTDDELSSAAVPRREPLRSPICSRRTATACTVGALVPMNTTRSRPSPKPSTRCASSASRPLVFAGHARATGPIGDATGYRLDTFGVDSDVRLRPAVGASASSSAWRRCSTARCSRTG